MHMPQARMCKPRRQKAQVPVAGNAFGARQLVFENFFQSVCRRDRRWFVILAVIGARRRPSEK